MPRIRSLKPEHRQHRSVGPLSDRTYRLWVSMINEADDEGRLVCDAAQLRVVTFGYHPKVTVEHVEEGIQTLAGVGRIILYASAGVRYAAFPKWHTHQHPKKPQVSVLPAPQPSDFIQHGNHGGTGGEPGGNQFPTRPPVVEGKGKERKGEEGLTSPTRPQVEFKVNDEIRAALNQAPTLGAVARLWTVEFWRAEIRANGELDMPAEILKAEAWIVANPRKAPRKDLVRFFHNWLARADREESDS